MPVSYEANTGEIKVRNKVLKKKKKKKKIKNYCVRTFCVITVAKWQISAMTLTRYIETDAVEYNYIISIN